MIEVRKRHGESPSMLLYRFTRRVKQSGILKEAKRRRFRGRVGNKRAQRLSALHRTKKRGEMARLRKWGLLA